MKYAMIFAALLLTGCDVDWKGELKTRCFNGQLYEQWNGSWVLADGRGYMGKTDGPIKCIAPGDNASLPK